MAELKVGDRVSVSGVVEAIDLGGDKYKDDKTGEIVHEPGDNAVVHVTLDGVGYRTVPLSAVKLVQAADEQSEEPAPKGKKSKGGDA